MLAIWHTSPGKSLDELKGAPIVLGSMGRTHLSYQWATLLKSAINAPFRVIPGFPTGGELNLAMERVLPLASLQKFLYGYQALGEKKVAKTEGYRKVTAI